MPSRPAQTIAGENSLLSNDLDQSREAPSTEVVPDKSEPEAAHYSSRATSTMAATDSRRTRRVGARPPRDRRCHCAGRILPLGPLLRLPPSSGEAWPRFCMSALDPSDCNSHGTTEILGGNGTPRHAAFLASETRRASFRRWIRANSIPALPAAGSRSSGSTGLLRWRPASGTPGSWTPGRRQTSRLPGSSVPCRGSPSSAFRYPPPTE